MTATVVMHLGECVLVATDTRTSFGRPTIGHRDDSLKLWSTSAGLISGFGYVPLLDAVKERFCGGIQHTSELQQYIQERVRWHDAEDPNYRSGDADITGWFVTYETHAARGTQLRLVHFPATKQAWHTGPNEGTMQLPDDAPPAERDEFVARLRVALRRFDDFARPEDATMHHIELARTLLFEASERYRSCGPWMSVGLHFLGQEPQVVPRIDTREPLPLALVRS